MTSEIDNVPFDGNQRVAPKRVRYQNVFINGKPAVMALAHDAPVQKLIDALEAKAARYPFATAEAFNEAVSDLLGNSRIDPLSLGLALTMGTLAMQRATAFEYDFLNGAPVLVKRCDHPVTGAPLRLGNVDDGSTMSF